MQQMLKLLVLGGDGYLGWPTAMHFARLGHEVMVVDNFAKRALEMEEGIEPIQHVPPLHRRIKLFAEVTDKKISLRVGDLLNARFIYKVLEEFKPDAIIHYAEQPSAPYSMQSRQTAVYTQSNNVIGNLNLLFGIRSHCPNAHLIKLGTMGAYGTPNIDIEEGYITISHNGRTDHLPFPKQPGSFYHLSKVHDSANILFACRIWGLRATDLNQGVVYGIDTEDTKLHPELCTSFHYDDIFGTVLNRFCTQAVFGVPLTVYGKGGQTRGYLNIRDTIQCVELACVNPADPGECRVFNQLTEIFSVLELAEQVKAAAGAHGLKTKIEHLPNPRHELEEHYYNPKHTKLIDLGLKPRLLSDDLIESMIGYIQEFEHSIDRSMIRPRVQWKQP